MRAAFVALVICVLAACGGDDLPGDIRIVTDPQWEPVLREMLALTPSKALHLATPDDTDDTGGGDYVILVVDDPAIPLEGFRLSDTAASITVYAHDVLGVQYGVAAALEALGFRFRHPFDTYVPHAPRMERMDNAVQQPAIRVRGFQLHTLHPIEPYFAMWEPDGTTPPNPGALDDAKRIIDWTIKNRGNYVQWVALDDIITDADRRAAWLEHTKAIFEYGRARGVRFGVNIQLFGESNLQQAFDLIKEPDPAVRPFAEQIAERLPIITTMGVTFDVYHLSFGEFFIIDNDLFIGAINETEAQLRALAPDAEMHGFVHVGDTPRQRVDYMGENLIYYFLVKFASPTIVPDIHTVMFYNLFEDAGGAYHHENFGEHLAYLRERMCAGQKVSYVPETAYWVAFDNSVPMFLPLYVRSRWLDLDQIRAVPGDCGTLDQHILFSTGWEWGYWLNDVASLRASYKLTESPGELVRFQYAPDMGDGVGRIVDRLMSAQRQALIHDRLIAYVAGRDSIIDLGTAMPEPIIAAPDRIDPPELVASGDVAGFQATVMEPLATYADALARLETELLAYELPDSTWGRELRDGFAIDRARTGFTLAIYRATIAKIEGDDAEAERQYAEAQRLFARGKDIVGGRHRDLHDTHGRRLVDATTNRTVYQYGYLFYADNLCYWERELQQTRNTLDGQSRAIRSCFFGE